MNRAGSDPPRIYVADLAAYNNGKLHGVWIDAAQDAEAIQAEIGEMLKKSSEPFAEEWAIHDYENFGGLKLGEYESIESVARAAQLIEEHGPVFAALVDHVGGLGQLDEAERAMKENYQGAFKSLEDWAYEFAHETGFSDDACGGYASYVDWEKVAHDAELGGDIFTVENDAGELHIFWNH